MTDQAARESALDTWRSILLQAPAGSGKTTVLAQRFLRALAVVDDPGEVLAITFTRKAAAEMRERVLRALDDTLPGGQPDRALWQALRTAVLEQAARCGWAVEELPQRLRIQTIDSLAHEVARAMPLLGRMQSNLHVIDDATTLYRDAARETLRYGESDPAYRAATDLLLRRLDNNWDQAETLLAELLPGRNRWQPLLLSHAPESLGALVGASLARIAVESLARLHALLRAEEREEGEHLARESAANRHLAAHAAGPWQIWLQEDARLVADAAQLPAWQALAALLLKEDGDPRLQVTVNNGFPREDKALKERWRAWRDRVVAIPGALAALRDARRLPSPELDPAEHEALAALARVMLLAGQHLKLVFRERGLVDHGEIAAIARQALNTPESAEELARRQTLRVSHLLVDEFQDTSPEQLQLVQALTEWWPPGDHRSLFLVGDPMQSIYLFRDSEVGLFLQTRATGVGSLQLDALQLRRNFRSQPPLVQWANAVFPAIFPAIENLRSSAVTFLSADAARSAEQAPIEPQICALPQTDDDPEIEAAQIAARIAGLRSVEPALSIAVLVQTRALAAPVLRALRAAGITAVGVDLAALKDRPAVRDLVALGQALLDADDRAAWLAVLRSPPCGLLLADLAVLAEAAGSGALVDVLALPEFPAGLSVDAATRLARIAPLLVRAWRMRGSEDQASALENAWFALGGEMALQGREDLAAARQYLLALRRQQEQLGRLDAAALANLAQRLRDRGEAEGENAVEVLTIHHSKGLEWDVVFVPGLGRPARADQPPLLRWLQLPAPGGGSDLLLAVRSIGDAGAVDPLSRYIAQLQSERLQNERLRLLYVAVTRARRQLYLSGHAPRRSADSEPLPAARSLLRLLWPAVADQFASHADELSAAADASLPQAVPQQMLFHRVPATFQLPEATLPPLQSLARSQSEADPGLEFSWVGPDARIAGTVLHAELERLARLGSISIASLPAREAACVARLQEAGIPLPAAQRTAQGILRRLMTLVHEPRAHWLLFAAHQDSASELSLSGIVDGELRNVVIDRCFIDADGVRWVVDYKTGIHAGGGLEDFIARELQRYTPQLRLYRMLAGRLGPEAVRAALYFPWLGEFRELPATT